MCLNWAHPDGTVSPKLLDFYRDLADGGCGLVITGCAAVSPDSILYEGTMRAHDRSHLGSLGSLRRDIEARGAVAAIQLMNFGRQSVTTFTKEPVYGPSAIQCPVKSTKDPDYRIREMTLEDIERVKRDFAEAGALCAEAGFRVIQIHAAHGFLLNEFLSPYSNRRTDAYGGSVAGRARFVVEVIREVRQAAGADVVIDVRVSADELVEGGLRPADFAEILPLFEEAGIDMVNVSLSVSESTGRAFRQRPEPEARYVGTAEQLKRYTRLPVGYAFFVASLETAERLLAEGRVDLVGIGRAQLADPHIVKKSAEGRQGEIDRCKWDHSCLFSHAPKGHTQTYCTTNPKYAPPPRSTHHGETNAPNLSTSDRDRR